ncbi:MAG: indolepyruvate oxidoreductase subunit beta [Bacteroidales bacterium]|mgnify:FL=1|nr:indolepyruvate oxidoreductase subunit beta [Bacteroidales bacterium]
MKKDIILSGVGGQGILTIATIIGQAALKENLYLKQAEVHGMSQRGGDVQSNLRLSSNPIASDLISMGDCDLIISLEPMEALRYLPYLSKEGWIVSNEVPFKNIDNYPEEEKIWNEIKAVPNHILLNLDEIAKEIGSLRTSNIVLLGATTPFLNLEYNHIEESIEDIFKAKGTDLVNLNLEALRAGRNAAEHLM